MKIAISELEHLREEVKNCHQIIRNLQKKRECVELTDEPAQPKPVAWMVYTVDGGSVYVTDNSTDIQEGQRALPLYTTPPKREWVALTDEQRLEMADNSAAYQVVLATEAKLKEENT